MLCQLMQEFGIETESLRWARRCGLLTNTCIHLYSAHHMELEKYWMIKRCKKPEPLNYVFVAVLLFMRMSTLKPLFLLLCFRCCSSSDPSPRPGDFFRRSRQQQHSGTDSATSGWNPHFLQGKLKFVDNIQRCFYSCRWICWIFDRDICDGGRNNLSCIHSSC